MARTLQCALALSAALALTAGPLQAQDSSSSSSSAPPRSPAPAVSTASYPDYQNRWDFYGGYGYAHFTTSIGHAFTAETQGVNLQATAWFSPIFGLTAASRNYYGTLDIPPESNPLGVSSTGISQNMFLFGPDFRLQRNEKWDMGVHVLVGGTYGIFDRGLKGLDPASVNVYRNQLAFAAAAGASFDYNLSSKLAVRLVTDFEPTYYGLNTQKEFAGSLGVVYRFGSLHK